MKIIFIFLAFLYITKSYPQDPQLFDNTWYLQKIVLQDGTEHIPVPNEDVPFITITFYEESPYYFETFVCNYFAGEVTYQPVNHFLITHSEMSLLVCDPVEHFMFEGIQFGFFLTETNDHIEDPFLYEIITTGDEKTLLITNVRGDIAYYGDTYLSITDFETHKVALYPNPVSDKLVIESQENICQITVYDIQGKQLRSSYFNNSERTELDVSILQNGVYFIEIKALNGNSIVRKVIKQ